MALLLATCILTAAQAPSMPSWLASYPGATPNVHTGGGITETTYTTPAKPVEVLGHYRKLFETAGLPFQPNPDGIGSVIRAAAPECDLLILIHPQQDGTFVDASCASKTLASAPSAWKPVEIITSGPSDAQTRIPPRPGTAGPRSATPVNRPQPATAAEMQARHEEMVKKLGIHPQYRDAPAPPLVWPEWLVHIQGAELKIQQGVDQSKKAYLESTYVSTEPMSAIYKFYRNLLAAHEYPVHSSQLSTGQTISGVRQNAGGHVEGANYPDGAPGPRTVIRVSFTRFYLNEPITVRMRITAYEFVAPKSRF